MKNYLLIGLAAILCSCSENVKGLVVGKKVMQDVKGNKSHFVEVVSTNWHFVTYGEYEHAQTGAVVFFQR